ncbi:MAG: hypothetical protein H6619_01760 [Deltaproteobacteria bacterium]|nr:hypothetical protein [Deltaproteobacteria bacterium]
MTKAKKSLQVALLCGGPSLERGISLNSARSACDHLHSEQVTVNPIYFDHQKKAYKISRGQLYSNTPSDFDFKLASSATPLTRKELRDYLSTMDLALPAIHGPFGEDGELQTWLEKWKIPFVGSTSESCHNAFDKHTANQFIAENGFFTLPSAVLQKDKRDHRKIVEQFFSDHKLARAIVKPATGGSSIAVYSVSSVEEALEKSKIIFRDRVDERVVLEPFCEGKEFTVILLENRYGMPVAIMPTEIELDYTDHQIFDYRRKYLATRQVTYHCPPRFDDNVVERIQIQSEQLYTLFGMKDFARFDGWLLPDGNLWFSDFNPISGMEQNSFLFMQSARIGMSHRNVLEFVVQSACRRYQINFPKPRTEASEAKKPINVIFGGDTAERQVSLMSGTNVWLKLRNSKKYEPQPYILDSKMQVWRLPYPFALNHTCEEIIDMCHSAEQDDKRLSVLKRRVLDKLAPEPDQISEKWFLPEKMSLEQFLDTSEAVFIGLHGGMGEDGRIQAMLEERGVPFNGPSSKASHLCADKHATGLAVAKLEEHDIYTAKKRKVSIDSFKGYSMLEYNAYWDDLTSYLGTGSIIVKPVDDGCSAGVVRLFTPEDLRTYIHFAQNGSSCIPADCLTNQHGIIEMPTQKVNFLLFEEFITTDKVEVVGKKLKWQTVSGWIEVTVGILEENGKIRSLNPSITVASGNILSLEEKFQGGTGVNITPPPQKYVSALALKQAKKRIEIVASELGLQGYSRIDAFMNVKTGKLVIIEVNTLPGLTASTVIFHQALAEKTSLSPVQFVEKICDSMYTRFDKHLEEKRNVNKHPGVLKLVSSK